MNGLCYNLKSYEPKYHVIKGPEQIWDDLMQFQAQLENRLTRSSSSCSSCSRATGTSKSIFQLGLKWHQIISNLFRTLDNVLFRLKGHHFDAWGIFTTWNWEMKKFPVARLQLVLISWFSSWALNGIKSSQIYSGLLITWYLGLQDFILMHGVSF